MKYVPWASALDGREMDRNKAGCLWAKLKYARMYFFSRSLAVRRESSK